MKIQRHTESIMPKLESEIEALAYSNAKALSVFTVGKNDPFLLLAETEVCLRVRSDLELLSQAEAEIITAVDDADDLVGFISYKPRRPGSTCASITYVVVRKDSRRCGVMRSMMAELITQYPVLGLDCPIGLVPIYEQFGFYVDSAQGSHIGMQTGPLSGVHMSLHTEDLVQDPQFKAAVTRISNLLGEKSHKAFKAFNKSGKEDKRKAQTFIQSRKK